MLKLPTITARIGWLPILLLPLLALCPVRVQAQPVKLPAGYDVQPDPSGAPSVLRYDFDGDGAVDLFCAAEKPNSSEPAKLIAVLRNGRLLRSSLPFSMCCGVLSQKGGVVTVGSRGMRGFSYFKFRWDRAAGDFRLIGFDTESFGNAANDGSGRSSLNLLTGDYEAAFNAWNEGKGEVVALPEVRRRIKLGRRIFLKDFGEEAYDWLTDLNYANKPKELR